MLSRSIFHGKWWMLRRVIALLACVLLAAAVLVSVKKPAQVVRGEYLPLPDVSGTVTLRVAYVENPRFLAISPTRLNEVLALTRREMQQQLGVNIEFLPTVTMPIAQVFSALSPVMVNAAEHERLDATLEPTLLWSLRPGLLKDLQDAGDLATQKRFASGYLLREPQDPGDLSFVAALLATQHGRLRQWGATLGLDGKPAIGPDRYNEYAYWDVIGSTLLPFEVVVTNQLIASAEKSGNSVHSAIRGGLSNGITTHSVAGRFKLVSILSSYAFIDPSPLARQLRGGMVLTENQESLFMARVLVHELGHQLLHLGHPFDNPHCVMAPPKALEFQAWSEGLDAKRCALGSSKAQTPGFIKFSLPEVQFRNR